MRHGMKKHNVGTTPAHRRSMLRNLAVEIIDHGQIKSTHAKCKAVKPMIEKLITLAKEDSVSNRRLAYTRLNDRKAVNRLFTEVAPRFKGRPGGYTRIMKLADGRMGDNAKMSYIALVD